MSEAKDAIAEEEREDELPSEASDTDAPPAEVIDLPEGTNLMQALIDAQNEARANLDGWQRARAEFANFKQRAARERTELYRRATVETLGELLPIIDDFDRAFANVPEAIAEDAWYGGVVNIQRKFETLLERHELEAIDPTGAAFDPEFHQAIAAEDSDEVESGYVIETLQKGYRAGSQVLRLALVKVAN